MRLVWATVTGTTEHAGMQSLSVDLDDGSRAEAVCYPALSGACAIGDRVLLNTTAVGLGLGTGGRHFVVSRLGEGSGTQLDTPSGGHIMKLRYTPSQVDVVSVESPESPHHHAMSVATSIDGMPVVCCGLHSQVPLVAAAIKQLDPGMRIAYCMTDQAALALPLSDVVRACVEAELLDATVSCGQAFGGQYEAINLHSGLLAATSVCRADVTIVAIGPGVAGTATPFGHGGVAQGESLNAVSALGGVPIVCLRVSFADARQRHRGVSHHTLTALTRVALAPAKVALPTLEPEFSDAIDEQLESSGAWSMHVPAPATGHGVSAPSLRGVRVTSMGRGPEDDPAFFLSAYAAGEIAFRTARSVL